MKTFPRHFLAIILLAAASLAPLVARAQCTPPASGLVGWWKGDGTAMDLVSSNNGTLVNVAYSNGVVNQTFSFDPENYSYGTYTGVKISDRPEYALTNSLTIEGWVRIRGASYVVFFRGDGRPGLDPYALGFNGNNDLGFFITAADGSGTNLHATLNYNEWVHVAATLNGTNGQMMFYTNGILAAQAFTAIRPLGALDNNQSPGVGIGNVNDGLNTFPFIGDVDEIALYKRALSQTEIQAIVTAGSAGKCTSVVSVTNSASVPVITSFTPASGTNGSLVTILGTNFNATAASNIVYFGAVKASVLSASVNSLTVVVPVGAAYAPITVTVGGLTAWASAPFMPTFAAGTNSLALATRLDLPAGDASGQAIFADVDGDGKPDLLVNSGAPQFMSVYRNISTNGALLGAASFAPRVDVAMPGNIQNAVLADVDGDGKLDIAVLDRDLNTVHILKNVSTPGSITTNSFVLAVNLTTGNDPRGLVVRDLNADGLPEIAVANWADNNVSVFRNLGTTNGITTNSFAARVNFSVGANPQDLKAADLNGDSKPDLITANNNTGTTNCVSVLRNTATGSTISFSSQVALTGMPSSYCLAIGDLDGDGKQDLVVSSFNQGQSVSVYRNVSTNVTLTTNSFAANVDFAIGGWGNGVAIGDLDGDGKPDLAVVAQLPDHLSVFKNISTPGSFSTNSLAARVDFATGWNPNGVAIGDLDGDGRPDIEFAIAYGATLSIYQNLTALPSNPPVTNNPVTNNPPVITSVVPLAGTNGALITIAGTNFNTAASSNIVYFGAVKAAVLTATANSLMVVVPVGATFAPITVTVGGLTAYAKAAFLPKFAGNGSGISAASLGARQNLTAPSGPISTVIADIDGDGKPDLICANVFNNNVSIYRNISVGGTLTAASFAARVDLPTTAGVNTPNSVVVADVDGDGRLDIIIPEYSDNLISVYRNNSTPGSLSTNSFSARLDFVTGTSPYSAAVQDVDGDGRPDILTVNNGAGTVSILRNTGGSGSNLFAAKVDFAVAANSAFMDTGDLNGDGKPDLAVAGDGFVSILQNNISSPGALTTNSFARHLDLAIPSGGISVRIADLDGDGQPDLATTTYLPQIFSVLRNTGIGGNLTNSSFAPRIDYALNGRGHTLAFGDLDGDGKLDVAVVSELADRLSVFRNTSTPGVFTNSSLASQIEFATGYNAWGVSVGDLDGDGRPDVVLANQYDNNLSIYQNQVPFATNAAPPPSPSCTTVPAGIVAWLSGENNSVDNTGTNNGMLSASGASYAAGKVNQGFRFDGTNGFVQIPDSASLKPASVTAEAWVYLDPNLPVNRGGEQIIFKKNTWTAFFEGYSLLKTTVDNGNGTFSERFEFTVSRTGNQVVIRSQTLAQRGVWYHVAATYDGNKSTLFINGVAEATATAGFALDYDTTPVFIGTSGTWAPYLSMFGGIIDEPTIYGRALTTNEIAAIYNAGSAGKCTGSVVLNAPSIVTQPTNFIVTVSGTAVFSVAATGTQPLNYQWSVNGTNLASATNAMLMLSNVQLVQAGNYSVVVSNFVGSAASSNAVLNVLAPPACTAPASGLVAWLAGEGNFTDWISGNTATNSGVGFSVGKVASAFSFNVSNAAVFLPASSALDVGAGTGFTLEAWIKPADLAQPYPIFEWNDMIYWGVHFFTGSSAGELYANIPDSFGTWHQMSSPGGVLVTNAFQHVALTYDKASGMATMYDNGQIVAQQNMGSFTPRTTSRDLYIGRRPAPIADAITFAGQLDEPSVYNRALTTNEIAAIFNAGSAGKCFTLAAPLVVTQPTNLTVTVNNTAVFNVTATGTQPLFYQWSFNGTNISGATNISLTLNNVSPSSAGNYSVLVSNFLGTATSSNAVLNVFVPPVPPFIISQTPSQVVLLNNSATFTVNAGGTAPLNYFWKKNNVLIPGATNFFYTIPSAQFADSGKKFSCLVTNAYGTASSTNSSLKVINTIYNDLCSGAVIITNASYTNTESTANASSYGDPTPDCVDGFGNGVWYSFTAPVSGLLDVDTYGSDFDTGLAIYAGSCGSLAQVDCNDDTDGFTSELVISTTAGVTYYFLVGGYSAHVGNLVFHLKHFTPPAFDVQPTNLAVIVSSNGTFSATLSGTLPIALQWYFNNAPLADGGRISGVTNATLNLANVIANDGGNYYLVASNFVGVTTSSVAVLTPIILPPFFLVQPSSQSVLIGSNVNFFAVVDGTPPYAYQWYRNGNALTDNTNITGSTTLSLSISNLTTANAGNYTLLVTNVAGATNSLAATLTVLVPPSITLNPISRSVPPGWPTIFTANASGILTPTYQWQLNGTNLPGATSKNYTNPAVGINDLGFYHVVASNSVGTATSADAQLTFGPVAAWGRNLNNECLPPPGLTNVFGVAGMFGASFALRTDGTIAAWGAGTGTNIPASASNVVAVATSTTGNYALRSDGQVVSWNGLTAPGLTNIIAVAAGFNFGYALRADGTLTNWAAIPTPGFAPSLSQLTAIACGYNNAVALRSDGKVFVSGTSAVTNVPGSVTNVIAIAAGYTYAMALRADGRVIAWGSGAITNLPASLTNIVAIAAGNYPGENFGVAIRADGRAVAFGDNSTGETNPPAVLTNLVSIAGVAAPYHGLALVSDGSPVIIAPPIGLTAFTGRDVTLRGVAAGAAPLSYQWLFNGTNLDGATNASLPLVNLQLANTGGYQLFVSNYLGTTISIPALLNVIVSPLTIVSQPAATPTNLYQAGKFTIGGITVNGSGPLRYQWFFSRTNTGYAPVAGATNDTLLKDPAFAFDTGNYYVAVSNLVSGFTSAPVTVRVQFARSFGYVGITNPPVNVTNAIALATGGVSGSTSGHYLALGADGKVTAWVNYFQTAGNSGETNLSALSNSIVTAIAASSAHTLALKSDGTVAVFGGGATNVPNNLNGVTAVACGVYHDLALKSDGTVAGWLTPNQLNYGQATNTTTATNLVAIAAGQYHSLGLRADGLVIGWGNPDGAGQIPPSATNVIAITAGNYSSVALRGNGTVVEWGGGIANYPVPSNLSNVVAISASGTHVTALKNDGTVVTWGNDYQFAATNLIPSDLTNVIGIASGGDHDIALFGTRAPAFTVQPWNRAVTILGLTNITLTGKVAGVQPMSYQWRLNGTNYPGATNDSLTLINFSPVGAGTIPPGTYQLVASNSYGVAISKPAKVTIVIPLAVALDTTTLNWLTSGSAPWYGQTNYVHSVVSFVNSSAARSGGIGALQETILQTTLATNFPGTVSFWWKVSSEQFFDTLEFRVNGTVQASISGEVDWQFVSIPVTVGTNVLMWRYSKDGSFDSGLDAAFLDQVTFLSAPVINLQPSSVVANLGQNISLRVVAAGIPAPSYQWTQNGNPVGGNTPLLTLNNVARAQVGTYSVIVTNAGGMAISSNAAVVVKVPQLLGTPVLLPDGSLQLTSADANGGQLAPSDLANFEAQASTNLVNWTTLPDGLSLTNGMLQLNDAARTNFTARYYRIVEH